MKYIDRMLIAYALYLRADMLELMKVSDEKTRMQLMDTDEVDATVDYLFEESGLEGEFREYGIIGLRGNITCFVAKEERLNRLYYLVDTSFFNYSDMFTLLDNPAIIVSDNTKNQGKTTLNCLGGKLSVSDIEVDLHYLDELHVKLETPICYLINDNEVIGNNICILERVSKSCKCFVSMELNLQLYDFEDNLDEFQSWVCKNVNRTILLDFILDVDNLKGISTRELSLGLKFIHCMFNSVSCTFHFTNGYSGNTFIDLLDYCLYFITATDYEIFDICSRCTNSTGELNELWGQVQKRITALKSCIETN